MNPDLCNSKIDALTSEYKAKIALLEKEDADTQAAIEALTTEYNAKVAELEAADKANADALAAHKEAYEAELALLQKADADNAAAITALITFIIEYRHHKKNAGSDGVHGTKFTDEVMFWIDSVGLAIYTVVGVAVGYEAGTDNFFVLLFSGVVTGVGGGLLRDVMAQNMPYIFVKHIYASACIVGSIVARKNVNIYSLMNELTIGMIFFKTGCVIFSQF